MTKDINRLVGHDYNDLLEQIRRHEGERLKPYRCSAGKLTIGVGRNLEDVGITREESTFLLQNDIFRVLDEVRANFSWFGGLCSVRKRVIADMCFNLGIGRLKRFRKMIAAIERQDWDEAGREMMDSRWAGQVKDRARTLERMMVTGVAE